MPDSGAEVLGRLMRSMHHADSDPLRPLIDRYFMERGSSPRRMDEVRIDLVERPRPGGRISPSTLGGCQRQAAFKFLGMKARKVVDPDAESIFDDGNWRHRRWSTNLMDMQRVLGRKTFRVLAVELDVDFPELYISGSLDVEAWIKGFGYCVIDFKGINDAGYTRISMDNKPLDKHVLQLVAYLKSKNRKLGLLMYENKNNNHIKCFVVRLSSQNWEQVELWTSQVLEYIRRRRLPPKHPECQRGNFVYDKCPYSRWCFGQREADEVSRIAYKSFQGLNASWEAGNTAANVS